MAVSITSPIQRDRFTATSPQNVFVSTSVRRKPRQRGQLTALLLCVHYNRLSRIIECPWCFGYSSRLSISGRKEHGNEKRFDRACIASPAGKPTRVGASDASAGRASADRASAGRASAGRTSADCGSADRAGGGGLQTGVLQSRR